MLGHVEPDHADAVVRGSHKQAVFSARADNRFRLRRNAHRNTPYVIFSLSTMSNFPNERGDQICRINGGSALLSISKRFAATAQLSPKLYIALI
jgi:hypothetical protein